MLTTIRQGQRAAVWRRDGGVTLVDGPTLVMTLGKTVERAACIRSLGGIGVDLTRHLVAQYRNSDRVIGIDGGQAALHPLDRPGEENHPKTL